MARYPNSPYYASDRSPSLWPWVLGTIVVLGFLGAAIYFVGDDISALRDRADSVRSGNAPAPTPADAAAVAQATESETAPTVAETAAPATDVAATAADPPVAEVDPATTIAPTEVPPPTPAATVVPPETVVEEYVALWTDGDYDGLYDLISAEAQSTIARQDFVSRYQGIAERAGLTSLTATVEGAQNLQGEVPIRIEMESSFVGAFTELNRVPVIREDNAWRIDWTPSLIFEDLGADGCVDRDSEPASRGAILDRDRNPLAFDGTVHRVGIVPGEIEPSDEDRVLRELSELADIPTDEIKALYADKDPSWFVAIKDFPEERGDELLNVVAQLPGASVQPATARVYPMGAKAAHITGYISEVTAEQLDADASLVPGQLIGQAGIEAGADELLTGRPGGRLVVVQCETRAERAVIAERPPVPAKDVVLTIDRDLQEVVDAALSKQGNIRGSSVIIDPRSGAILALASHPTFDPNGFVLGFSPNERRALEDEAKKPLLNRAVQAAYPTGSIFKAITFSAAMEGLGYAGDLPIDCPSTFSLEGSNQVWEDWTVAEGIGPQGTLTLHQALVNSCNTVFYQLGRDLDEADEEMLPNIAKAFGLGAPTEIPYLPEVGGTVPDPKWKLDTYGDYWATGDAINLSIGQGFLEATPLQMANAYAAIANGGDLLQPYIVKEALTPDGASETVGQRRVRNELPLSRETIVELQSALRDQTSDLNGAGSARVFGDFEWPIAGKTGTAQNGTGPTGAAKTGSDRDLGDRGEKPHSWFAAFGPYGEEATITSIVMIENAGEGVSYAAPATRDIYEAYLRSDLAAGG